MREIETAYEIKRNRIIKSKIKKIKEKNRKELGSYIQHMQDWSTPRRQKKKKEQILTI